MADVNQLISDFYRVAQERDFARDFQFRVLSINAADSGVTFDNDDLVYIRTATLPERAIQNKTVPYMGLNFNVPGSVLYPNSEAYAVEFYADAQSKIRQKFEDWSRSTFDDANSTGNYFTPKQSSTIDLVQLDAKLVKVAQYQLVGVSVRNVGPLAYNIADGTGETLKFTATLAYHYWKRVS